MRRSAAVVAAWLLGFTAVPRSWAEPLWVGFGAGGVWPRAQTLGREREPGPWVSAHLRIPLALPMVLDIEVGRWNTRGGEVRPPMASLTTHETGVTMAFVTRTRPVQLLLGAGVHIADDRTSRLMAHLDAGLECRLSSRIALFATARTDGEWPYEGILGQHRAQAGLRVALAGGARPTASASRARDFPR